LRDLHAVQAAGASRGLVCLRAPPRRGTVDLQKRHSAKTWRMSARPWRSCVSSTCYQDEPAAQTNCGYEVRWSAPRWACADAVRRVIAARWTHPAAQELPWWRRPQGLAPRAGAEHAKRREQHRQIPEHVITRAIHAERIFESPILWNHKMPNDMALAVSAAEPTAPIATALGSVPCTACQTTVAITQRPNAPMLTPLAKAAMAR